MHRWFNILQWTRNAACAVVWRSPPALANNFLFTSVKGQNSGDDGALPHLQSSSLVNTSTNIIHCGTVVWTCLCLHWLYTSEPRGVNKKSYTLIGQFEWLSSCITSTSPGHTWGIQIMVTDNRTLKLLMCILMLVVDCKFGVGFLIFYQSGVFCFFVFFSTNYLFWLTDSPKPNGFKPEWFQISNPK